MAAAAAVVLFALCPLGIFFHRAVLLDNPSLAFAIAAFALAWTPKHRLWAFVGSGVCFALSVLCKETTLDLLPALLLAVFQNSDRRTRRYCLTLFLSSFLLAGGFYPLYATLKGELLPGTGHVSLLKYLVIQLFSRQSTGSVLDVHSQSHAIVAAWLQLDPWLLGLALAVVPIALARRTTRAIALAFLIQVVTVFRPGYLPNMYVIGMLPFAALMVPGSLEAAWGAGQPAGDCRLRVGGAIGRWPWLALVLTCPAVGQRDRQRMTLRQDGPNNRGAVGGRPRLPRGKRVIVDDEYWIYFIDHGYNHQPKRGGFFSSTVISYRPLDYDPAVKKAFPRGWRDFNFIVVTQAIVDTLTKTPTAAEAITTHGWWPGSVRACKRSRSARSTRLTPPTPLAHSSEARPMRPCRCARHGRGCARAAVPALTILAACVGCGSGPGMAVSVTGNGLIDARGSRSASSAWIGPARNTPVSRTRVSSPGRRARGPSPP